MAQMHSVDEQRVALERLAAVITEKAGWPIGPPTPCPTGKCGWKRMRGGQELLHLTVKPRIEAVFVFGGYDIWRAGRLAATGLTLDQMIKDHLPQPVYLSEAVTVWQGAGSDGRLPNERDCEHGTFGDQPTRPKEQQPD